MFNFKKYPELIPYSAGIKADKLFEEIREFDKEYGQKVLELLKDVKPKLLNGATKEYEDWDTVVEHFRSKNTENGLVFLVCAVEEAGGRYRFPPEYYDPDLTDKML